MLRGFLLFLFDYASCLIDRLFVFRMVLRFNELCVLLSCKFKSVLVSNPNIPFVLDKGWFNVRWDVQSEQIRNEGFGLGFSSDGGQMSHAVSQLA